MSIHSLALKSERDRITDSVVVPMMEAIISRVTVSVTSSWQLLVL